MSLSIVSEKFRLICLLIAKNATSTLRKEFKRLDPMSQELRSQQIGTDFRQRFTSICFLRDPVTRVLSAYQEISMRIEGGHTPKSSYAFARLADGPARLEAFLDWIENGSNDSHVLPQADFVHGQSFDLWGRVETLQTDLETVYNLLALGPCPSLPLRRSRAGRAKDYHYAKHLFSEDELPVEITERIRRIYSQDFELMNSLEKLPKLSPKGSLRGDVLSRKDEPSLDTGKDIPQEPQSTGSACPSVTVVVQLAEEHCYHTELESGSPLLAELKTAWQDRVASKPPRFLQLPLQGGRTALSFSSTSLMGLEIESGATSPGHQHGDPMTWYPDLWRWAVTRLGVQSVLDVGCGEGLAAAFFRDLGCRVLGIDGSSQAKQASRIPDRHIQHDYTNGPYTPAENFDLVWSCEFVEHVEAQFSSNFLATFAAAGRYLLMTHATPG